MAYFEIKNVAKSFGKTEVLKNVHFSMEEGQVVSIIGSSGSGKTTLLRCINFLCEPDQGEFYLEGECFYDSVVDRDASDEEKREKRMNFGLVFQNFNLFPQYNVKENLTLAPLLREKERCGKNRAAYQEAVQRIEARADEMLLQVGLTEKALNYPCELSGGQQQRVAIARALMLSPRILCFDEPTSALDPELTGEVLRVLKELALKKTTMIIVTHEMNFAASVSDKIVFMADGVIEEEGAPDEIFRHPKSARLKAFLAHDNEG